MERNRPRTRVSWTTEDFHSAMDYVRGEMCSLRPTSIKFNNPYRTFKERTKKGKTDKPKMGNATILTEKQERDLTQHILLISNLFYGVMPTYLLKPAYQYPEANNIKHLFNKDDKLAGYEWFYGLIKKKKPSLSIRKPAATSVHRISAFNRETTRHFTCQSETMTSKHNFSPNRIFYIDDVLDLIYYFNTCLIFLCQILLQLKLNKCIICFFFVLFYIIIISVFSIFIFVKNR